MNAGAKASIGDAADAYTAVKRPWLQVKLCTCV